MCVDPRLNTVYNNVLRRRLSMSIERVDGCFYRIEAVVGNVTDQSFGGLPSSRNLTLLSQVHLKSLSYAFPR